MHSLPLLYLIHLNLHLGDKLANASFKTVLLELFKEENSFFKAWFQYVLGVPDGHLLIKLLIMNGIDNR